MDKRLLLAVVLSIIVLLVYPLYLAKVSPPSQDAVISMQPMQKQEVIEKTVEHESDILLPEELPIGALSKTFTTDRYALTISNIGGAIQKLEIKDAKRLDIELVNNAFYQSGILSLEGKGPFEGLSSQPFEIKKDTNVLSIVKNGIKIEKDIKFLKDRYGFIASIRITNQSNSPQVLSYEITTASRISKSEIYESRYIEAMLNYKDGSRKRISGGKLRNYNAFYNSNIEWLALKNKYYSIIAKPDFDPEGVFTKSINKESCIGFIINDERILPGETRQYDFIFYVGPTEIIELEKVDKSFGKALDFGIFTGISLVLLSVLKFFYNIVHNYGVSILLLTCCVSLLLFPLSFKSLKSMRKLQDLHPHIEKVRSEHKDNPHKLNKEIMELYRRHKVNPMGGCFPMLLQMPIFIALYQTLMRSVELKGASFLWIKDLSMPDAAFRLPFSFPLIGNVINVLPILMIGAMLLQQNLSQSKTSSMQTEQQKMMGAIMPIVFGFIFYSLPSGLVLYWITNTILTGSLQFFLLRKA